MEKRALLQFEADAVPFPSKQEWSRFFRRLPRWIVVLILVLLFGRFVIVAVMHWIFG